MCRDYGMRFRKDPLDLQRAIRIYVTFADAYRQIVGKRPFDDEQWLEGAARFYIHTFYNFQKREEV